MEGCVMSCNTSAYGCCQDGETPAHGPDYEGCCLLYPYGCCPDNHQPAEGPHLEGNKNDDCRNYFIFLDATNPADDAYIDMLTL